MRKNQCFSRECGCPESMLGGIYNHVRKSWSVICSLYPSNSIDCRCVWPFSVKLKLWNCTHSTPVPGAEVFAPFYLPVSSWLFVSSRLPLGRTCVPFLASRITGFYWLSSTTYMVCALRGKHKKTEGYKLLPAFFSDVYFVHELFGMKIDKLRRCLIQHT